MGESNCQVTVIKFTPAGFSFRGDSRWLGMAHAVDTAGKDATTETIVAYAQTGSLFVARCSVTDQ